MTSKQRQAKAKEKKAKDAKIKKANEEKALLEEQARIRKEKEKKNLVLVKFMRSYTPYVKGEVAGFSKKYAEKLFEAEIAVPHKK